MNRSNVKDKRQVAIAKDGGGGNAGHLAVFGFKILNDNLVLADQLVYQQCKAAVYLKAIAPCGIRQFSCDNSGI